MIMLPIVSKAMEDAGLRALKQASLGDGTAMGDRERVNVIYTAMHCQRDEDWLAEMRASNITMNRMQMLAMAMTILLLAVLIVTTIANP